MIQKSKKRIICNIVLILPFFPLCLAVELKELTAKNAKDTKITAKNAKDTKITAKNAKDAKITAKEAKEAKDAKEAKNTKNLARTDRPQPS